MRIFSINNFLIQIRCHKTENGSWKTQNIVYIRYQNTICRKLVNTIFEVSVSDTNKPYIQCQVMCCVIFYLGMFGIILFLIPLIFKYFLLLLIRFLTCKIVGFLTTFFLLTFFYVSFYFIKCAILVCISVYRRGGKEGNTQYSYHPLSQEG